MRTILAASLFAALLATSSASKADGDERLHVAGGASALSVAWFGDDGSYSYKDDHFIEGEAGYAHRFGRHFELGAAYAFGVLGDTGVTVHRIMPVAARVFATPAEGVELGLTLRGGLLLGGWSSHRAYAHSVSFLGGVGGARIDGRFWLREHPHFGVLLAVESWYGLGSVKGDPLPSYMSKRLLAVSLPTFTAGVVVRL